jgi:hypothetical protein
MQDWLQRCHEKGDELKALVGAALRGAGKSGFDVCEVEKRVRALEKAVAALLPWSWEVPAPTKKESGEEADPECKISAGDEYLADFCAEVLTARKAVDALAASWDACALGSEAAAPAAGAVLWQHGGALAALQALLPGTGAALTSQAPPTTSAPALPPPSTDVALSNAERTILHAVDELVDARKRTRQADVITKSGYSSSRVKEVLAGLKRRGLLVSKPSGYRRA